MALRILYFAWVRERIGLDQEEVDVPAEVGTIAELIDWLSASSASHREAFADRAKLRAALDDHFVPLDTPIAAARELALFPPVTGG